MSKINLNNYESYLLDFLEGNLSEDDTQLLQVFALLHPELNINFDEELVSLSNESHAFANKNNLKANFNDELVIGYLENTLNATEKKNADELFKNNTLFKSELAVYKKTIAVPDTGIVYEHKGNLKRKPKTIWLFQSTAFKAAAAVLLLVGLWYVFPTEKTVQTKEIANTPIKTTAPKNKLSLTTSSTEVSTPIATNKLVASSKKPTYKKTPPITPKDTLKTSLDKEELKKEIEPKLAIENIKPKANKNAIDTNEIKLAKSLQAEKMQKLVIIEQGYEEQPELAKQTKNKALEFASKLFKKLNRNGVEKLNGSDNNNELVIGGLTISHKK